MDKFCEIDEPFEHEMLTKCPAVEKRWDIPVIDYAKKVKNWKKLSPTEKQICRLTSDPYLFYHTVLGYKPVPFHGELLWSCARNDMLVDFAPVGHGKTTAVGIGYPLWCYLCDCNVRIAILSSTEDLTKDKMREIEKHLIENEAFVEVFYKRWGHVPRPDRITGIQQEWSLLSKVCYRTKQIGVKDATFVGTGIFGDIFGRRFDIIILDDILNPVWYQTKNTEITEKVINTCEGNIFNRFELSGETERQVKMIGTFESDIDYYHYVIDNYWRTWKIYLYRSINRIGSPHRRDLSQEKFDIEAKRADGIEVEDVDVAVDTGI